MEQKHVSFKVAKAIKDAGFPQSRCRHWYSERGIEYEWYGDIGEFELIKFESDVIAPTYFDVWLWLWREKGIKYEIVKSGDNVLCKEEPYIFYYMKDPEEAIIAAIDYLVNNDLIK